MIGTTRYNPRALFTLIIVIAFADRLRVATADCPALPNGVRECVVTTDGIDPAVAADEMNRFIVTWATNPSGTPAVNQAFVMRFAPTGDAICDIEDECPAFVTLPSNDHAFYKHLSIAVTYGPAPVVGVGWIGNLEPLCHLNATHYLGETFLFDLSPFVPPKKEPPTGFAVRPADIDPSVGINVSPEVVEAVGWANLTRTPDGLVYDLDIDNPAGIQIRDLDLGVYEKFQPCVSVRSDDGYYIVAFSDGIPPDFFDFNIVAQLYDPSGTLISEATVNTDVSSEDTAELSPSVSFVNDHVAVCWNGARPDGCETGGPWRIYARHTTWSGTGPLTFSPSSPQFIVDTDLDWSEFDQDNSNPTISLNPTGTGEFIVGWNGKKDTAHEIRARYYALTNGLPTPLGGEFRVNQYPAEEDYVRRELAQSGQHTVSYRTDGAVVAAWWDAAAPSVRYTILPDGYAQHLCSQAVCLKGDCNLDGYVNGLDVQWWVNAILRNDYGVGQCAFELGVDAQTLCPFDTNCDCRLTVEGDLPCFVRALLMDPCTCNGGGPGIAGPDCNGNGISDASELYRRSSLDCNNNGIPDECDIANETSADVDENGVPDECQLDCNGNSIPDSKDIADETSADLNANGIPDECEPDCNANNIPDDMDVDPLDPDGNSQVSADCNANGVPDECDPDCNSNGVPDDCDIDPLDPDGDEWVSPDCNENGMPDECDLAMAPPFGSYDCNENGIPDECDIANETSADCNGNGIPDECDIAAEISADTNENGIPDECEQEGRAGGGDSPSPPPSPLEGEGVEDAWAAYYDWVAEQQWGPQSETPMFEQFKRSVDKLRELGLLAA